MELARSYMSDASKATSDDRHALSCSFLINIQDYIESGVRYDRETVSEIVMVLLRGNLESSYTKPELRHWLLSREVVNVIARLNTGPDAASAILRGLNESVRTEGVGFNGLISWGAELVYAWFVKEGNTVNPTSPGFVFELFMFINLCAERQVNICGIRDADSSMDGRLLPLVSGALPTETQDTINKGDKDGHTVLHHSACTMRLPQVTRVLLRHPDINVNSIDFNGMTPLIRTVPVFVKGDTEAFATVEALLSDDRLDIGVRDFVGNTAIDLCLFMLTQNFFWPGEETKDTRCFLKFCQLAVKHYSVTHEMIQKIVTTFLNAERFPGVHGLQEQVIFEAASHQSFDINQGLNDIGQTIGHLAALSGKGHLLLKLMAMEHFNPDIQDYLGNTIIYYACSNLPSSSAKKVIEYAPVSWDFTHTNNEEETVLDYYERLSAGKRDPMVLSILTKRVGRVVSDKEDPPGVTECHRDRCTVLSEESQGFFQNRYRQPDLPIEGTNATLPHPEHTVDVAIREIQWNSPVSKPDVVQQVTVQSTTQAFVNTKLLEIAQNEVYRITSAKKGKACIICISEFLVESLESLNPGYMKDSKLLVELWSQMGYEVYVPSCLGNGQLTAEEINIAVCEFAQLLKKEDPSAILCLLSHGGQGYIYGSDGKTVSLELLLKNLDNEKCPQMKEKPKVSIVQACAGRYMDCGVPASRSMGPDPAYSAANDRPLPTMSDFIICSATQPGFQSYVRKSGSVFIKSLEKIFAGHAKEDDIQTLMTLVNQEVSEEDIIVANKSDVCKQISRMESCLTKIMYFFPCKRGKDGKNWQILTTMK